MTRNFAAELIAARQSDDWEAHARIWEERKQASVDYDEAVIADLVEACAPEPAPPAKPLDPGALLLAAAKRGIRAFLESPEGIATFGTFPSVSDTKKGFVVQGSDFDQLFYFDKLEI